MMRKTDMTTKTGLWVRTFESLRHEPLMKIWPMLLFELLGLGVFFHVIGGELAIVLFLAGFMTACAAGYVIRRASSLQLGFWGLELRFVAIFPKAAAFAFMVWLTIELSRQDSIHPAMVAMFVLPVLAGFLLHAWWAPEFEGRGPGS